MPKTDRAAPLVSCVMTAYNVGDFLRAAVTSVVKQTYPVSRIELIIVDDGSTDATRHVAKRCLRSYPGPSNFVVKPNGGPASALSAGIAAATGDYIAILDGDDEWLPEKVAQAVAILEAQPAVGLVYSDIDLIDETGTVLEHNNQVKDRTQSLIAFPTSSHTAPLPVGRVYGETIANNCTLSSTIVVRRSLAPSFAPLPAYVPFYDWWITTRVAAFSEIAISDTLTRYRRHASNMTINLTGDRLVKQLVRDLEFRRKLLTIDPIEMASTAGLTRAVSEIARVGLGLSKLLDSPFVHPFSIDDTGQAEAAILAEEAQNHPEHSHERVVLLTRAFARDPYKASVLHMLLKEYWWFRARPDLRTKFTSLTRFESGPVHVVVTAAEMVEDQGLRELLWCVIGPRAETVVGIVASGDDNPEAAARAILEGLPPGSDVHFEVVDAADASAVAELVGAGLVYLSNRLVPFPFDRLPQSSVKEAGDLRRVLATDLVMASA